MNEVKFYRNIFPVFVLFRGFLRYLPEIQVEEEKVYCAAWRRTLLARGTNVYSASDERVENVCSNFTHAHTATAVATSHFQTELISHPKAGGSYHTLILTCSLLPRTLHPQGIYAIAFFAGLNGLQVH